MDLLKELIDLEEKGVFIHTSWDHYPTGSNLNFSIEFRIEGYQYKDKEFFQTSWYNDNHEFGNSAQTYEAAVNIAKYFLEDIERANKYFMVDGFSLEAHEDKREIEEKVWSFAVNPPKFDP